MEAMEMKSGQAPARPAQEDEPKICGICEALVTKRGLLDCCDHMFCFSCIEDWATVTNLCPMCKSQFKLLSLVSAGDDGEAECDTTSGDKRTSDEAFSYFIDEEAVTCLDGDQCKLRAGQGNLEDTSVACDGCDRWYHACCVGFDPGKPCKTWLCPRCEELKAQNPAAMLGRKKDDSKPVDDMSFSFTESGESAIVISMVSSNETETEKAPSNEAQTGKAHNETQYLPVSDPRQKTSLDKLLDDLVRNGRCDEDEDDEEPEPEDEIQEASEFDAEEDQQLDLPEFDAEEEQQLEQEVQDIFKEAEEGDEELQDFMDVDNAPDAPEATELSIHELVSDDERPRPVAGPETQKREAGETQLKEGVRTRIIMKREPEEASLAETIRQQVMADRGCSQLSNDQLLAAYKAAVVKRPALKQQSKAPADGARENLKRKLYGGLRGRRVYDRDWDVAFWRDKVLGDKRKQAAQQLPETPVIKAEEEPADPIVGRVCLADSSLLPKADGANPLPAKGVSKPKPSDKISLMKAKASSSSKELEKDAADAGASKDKKKWALELLARKNKQQVKAENDGLSKSFANLAKLPSDMRPVLEPNPRSKVPTAVRQMHLNRFAELYLKNVTVGRNQDSVDAVNAALAMEKEMSEKTSSRSVYVNLCVRALSRGDTPTKQATEAASEDTVNEALLAAGLISDSPPGSPERGPEKVESGAEDETPKKKAKVEEYASCLRPPSIGKEGINALLEHLRREEVEQAVQPEPDIDSKETEEKQENDEFSGQENQEKSEEPALEEKHEAGGDGDDPNNGASEEPPKDDNLMDLDSRIDRVRSNIVQQMSENSGITEQIIRENAKLIEHGPKQPKPHHRHGKHPPAPAQAKPSSQAPASSSSVQKQVESYVKEHIRPLYKSGVIKGEQYQWTVSKTTAKVLQFHKDATSADFLIAEGSRVKKLAEQYLQRYAQEKQSGNVGR